MVYRQPRLLEERRGVSTPAPQVNDVMIVGGTKTPNLGKIRALKPDLIVMDREENPLKVYQTLFDEGFEIFVSSVESPSDVPDMLRALGAACDRNFAGEQLALLCEDSIQGINRNNPAFADHTADLARPSHGRIADKICRRNFVGGRL